MFLISGEELKIHCIFDESILSMVSENLQERFGKDLVHDKREQTEYVWEPNGGAVFMNDVMFKFKIDETNGVLIRSQHWNIFKKSAVEQLSSSLKYEDKFYKLHGYLFSLCLNKAQRDRLIEEIKKNTFKCDEISKVTLEKYNLTADSINKNSIHSRLSKLE